VTCKVEADVRGVSVNFRSTLLLAGLLAVCLAAAPMATASAETSALSWASPNVQVQARVAALPFGLYKSSNNEKYSFPVTPDYAIQYYGWFEPFQTPDARAAWRVGTETFAELQTCENPCNSSTSVPISAVIDGAYDSYLTKFGEAVAAFGHPVLLTFDHEMNGNWYPWGDADVTPSIWISAWQHVTSVISAIAPNAIWVWAPNIEQGAASVVPYWPGNGYSNPHVDVVGLDGYFSDSSATWANTFSQSVTDVTAVSGGDYPFIVAETGVASSDSDGASQIDKLIAGARGAAAAALMYFDFSAEWALTRSELSAFTRDVGRGKCHGSTLSAGRCRKRQLILAS
jgi:Glycosyl hydrolase family 26